MIRFVTLNKIIKILLSAKGLLLLFLMSASLFSKAQTELDIDTNLSPIEIDKIISFTHLNISTPIFFEDLEKKYFQQIQNQASISGYRIHILSTTNRNELNLMKTKIYQELPELKSFISYQAPNFKLRMGNYFYKIDAYRDLKKIKEKFGTGFIVAENINWNQLP